MKFLTSIKTIISLLIGGVLLFMAMAFMLTSGQEVFLAVKDLGRQGQQNVLGAVGMNIEAEYEELLFLQRHLMEDHKEELKALVDLVRQMVDGFCKLSEQGVLSKAQAQAEALRIVENLKFGKDDYFFIYNEKHIAIAHPDPSIRGKDISKMKDINGENGFQALRKAVDEKGFGYAVVRWNKIGDPKPAKRMIYGVGFPKWKWIIGSGIHIPDVEADVKIKEAAIIEQVQNQLRKVKVGRTGYFWLFDGKGKILSHPTLTGQDTSEMKDPVTGRDFVRELMAAADDPHKVLQYYWFKPNDPDSKPFLIHSHVKYFDAFDWYLVSSVYVDEMRQPAINAIKRQAVMVIGIVLICLCIVYFLVKKTAQPLARLTTHADRLIENDFAPIEGDTEALSSITFPMEVGRLAKTMLQMEMKLQAYIRNITEETVAKERMESELRIARDIQISMLPKDIEKKEFTENIKVVAEVLPARIVGGDFYDYFFIDATRICLVVGDVSDKGIPASLFMALSKALIRAAATITGKPESQGNSPGDILTKVNLELCRGNDLIMFVTVFLGILDLNTGEFLYSNAGHNPPYLISASGTCIEMPVPPGRPLGVSRSTGYQTFREVSIPGDTFFLFTDGVNEATDTDGAFYGEERLVSLLKTCSGMPIRPFVKGVHDSLALFAKGAPQADDITIFAVRLGKELHDLKEKLILRIENDILKIDAAMETLTRFARENGLHEEIVFKLCLAMEEIVNNIVSYAFDDDRIHFITVVLSVLTDDKIAMEIRDKGKPFNPVGKGTPNLKRSFQEKSHGGVGLFLATQFMDDTEYRREYGENVLIMKKTIPTQA